MAVKKAVARARFPFQYAVKPGSYQTAVNIHNPDAEKTAETR